MSDPSNAALLATLPLFRGLSGAEVDELAAVCESRALAAQQPLFREGEHGDGLYLLVTGVMDVVKKDAAGQHQTLAELPAPAVLGEMSLLADDAPRSATVIAKGPATLVKLPSVKLKALLDGNRPSAAKLVHNLARVLSRRLSQVDEKLVEVLGHKRREELAEFQAILTRWTF